jgi:hypothetical protein
MADEQFICVPLSAYPANEGHIFVINQNAGLSNVLEAPVFAILKQADHFDTIAGHARKLLAAGWEDDGSGFMASAYRELVSRGLLVPKSACDGCLSEKSGKSESPPPVTSLVIPTRERLPELQRCLSGFIENNEKHGHGVGYLVIDDSRSKGQGVKIRSMLALFASAGARLFYAGMEEKLAFRDELLRVASPDGLPERVMDFCLLADGGLAPTYGVNRNGALLATTGELVVMTDDDTLYEPVDFGSQERVLRLTSQHDPTVLRYFADRGELQSAVRASDVDVIACHEKLLGRSIVDCRSGLGPRCSLETDRIGPSFASSICRRQLAVRATMAGFWGDSGMGSPNAVIELRGESRDLAMDSEESYLQATDSREVFRSVSRYTISDATLFMTANSGMDNRTLLPPFFPVGRNEDGAFANILRLCAEDALIGHLPFAIYHAPAEPRRFPPGAFLDVTPKIPGIITAILGSFTPSPGHRSASERLSELGRHFRDLGTLETDDFEDQVRTSWLAATSRYIGFLENLLDVHNGQPDYWAEDVLSMIENFKDFAVNGSPAAPREYADALPLEQAKESCKRLVRDFGELLQWWPVIYGAAVKLREDGIRLARPV